MAGETSSTSGSGMKPETMALLSWIFAPITSLIWMGEKNDLVKFHAKQSLYFGIASLIFWFVVFPILSLLTLGAFTCLSPFLGLADFGVRVYMAVQANKGEKTKLPIVGDMAEKNA